MNSARPFVDRPGPRLAGGLRPGRQIVTVAAGALEEATPTRAAHPTTFGQAGALIVPGPFRRAADILGDVLGAVAIVLGIPFVILAVGIPIALCVRLLLWIGGLL